LLDAAALGTELGLEATSRVRRRRPLEQGALSRKTGLFKLLQQVHAIAAAHFTETQLPRQF
jgi:hypothetical protein